MRSSTRTLLIVTAFAGALGLGAITNAAEACFHGRSSTPNLLPGSGEVSEDYKTTHLLTVPVSLTKLLVSTVTLQCGLCDRNDLLIVLMRPKGLSVDTTGAVSATETFRLRVVRRQGGADVPYTDRVTAVCRVSPPDNKQFKMETPPASPTLEELRSFEYIKPGAALTVEASFP